MTAEPYVPIEELAKHLSVSVSTIRAWLRQGLIPKNTYIKAGNTYRFCVSKVIDALTDKDTPEQPNQPQPEEDAPVQLELDFNDPDQDA